MLIVLLVTSSLFTAKPPATAESMRAEATKLYRKKDYARACPLFAKAVEAKKDDRDFQAETLSDLGLCQLRAGDEKAAEATLVRALGAAGERDDVRKNVYFNLSLLPSRR